MSARAASGRGLHARQSSFVRALAADARDRLAAGPGTPARRAAWKAINAWCHSEGTGPVSRSGRTRHGLESFRYLFVKSLRVRAQKRRDDATDPEVQRAWEEVLDWVAEESLGRYVGPNGAISLPAHPREAEIEANDAAAPPRPAKRAAATPAPTRAARSPHADAPSATPHAPPTWFTQWLEREPTSHASISLALWLAFEHPAKSHPANEEDWRLCERVLTRAPATPERARRLARLADERPSWKAWLQRGGHHHDRPVAHRVEAATEAASTPTKKKTRRGRRGGRRHKKKSGENGANAG